MTTAPGPRAEGDYAPPADLLPSGVAQVSYGPCDRIEAEPEADPGRDYDGPELHSGTPEYQAGYDEYQAWAGHAGPENEPVPFTLTDQAAAALDAAPEPEPEAEP